MMRPQELSLSSWVLERNSPVLRQPGRHPALRHAGFEDKYDFQTVFYDCFWSDDGGSIMLIGPALLNLADDLGMRFFAMPSGEECHPDIIPRTQITLLSIAVPASFKSLRIESVAGTAVLVPQPNNSDLFAGRRVLMTLSQNNELEWIRDWIIYHQRLHGCDGVLIYDNNSTSYDLSDLQACLSGIPGIRALALRWPYPYGLFDGRLPLTCELWHGHFCQYGMIEHARWRFLASARSSLNLDIDELTLCEDRKSIFALAEESSTGYLKFYGGWVENLRSSSPDISSKPLHRDFWHVRTSGVEGCESKWAAVPSRIPRSAQFFVHEILCYAEDELAVRTGLRHYKAINVNWAVDTPGVLSERTRTRADSDLMADAELQDQLMIAFGDVPRSLETASSRAPASGAAKAAPDMSGSVWRAQDTPAEAHYCHGMYHLHTGAYGDAARSFRKALKRDPRFVPAYHALGRLYWSSGRPGAAERIFRRGLAHAPFASLIHYGLAEILLYLGLSAEALEHADTAIRLNDADSRAHFLRAKELLALGRPAEACAGARRVIEIQSDTALFYTQHSDAIEQPFSNRYPEQKSWGGWTILIDGLLQSNMAGEALAESDRLVKRYPASPAAHEARCRVLSRLREEEAARHELEKAIKLARGELEYRPPRALDRLRELHWYEDRACDLHRLLLLAGETQEALAVLKTTQRLHPGIHRISFLIAAHLREARAKEELREHLEASLQVFPRHPDLWREYGQALSEAGETAHAILALRRAVRLGARQPWLKTQLALFLIDEGSLEEAELILRDVLESGAGNGAALYGLSEAFRKKGQLQEAIEACRRAAALLESEAWIWSHLGDLLIQAKLLDEAEDKLKQAECLKPADMLTNFRIGRLHEERGEIADALERMSRAVSIEPRHGWLWRHYGNLLLAAGEDRKAEAAHRRADEADGAATRIEPMVTRAKADPERAN